MKQGRRSSDSTFELNLAPFLDIIVSIIPMLLLSVAFVQIKMIEAPTPQVVSEKTVATPPKPETTVMLRVSKTLGFAFEVTDVKGQISKLNVPLASGQFDFTGLLNLALQIKEKYPEVSSLQLLPEETVAFDDLVKVMDTVREKPRAPQPKLSVTEAVTAKAVEASYLFPDVVFASVGG